ncbi:protoporphyrinogen/coproporphyrinogen oxidase [Microbacterium hominis]|uniref:FAD-dependent oxidoreductase n=1 Tax=Microbacterium hominis TaxID=162426 RepID=A0A7D4PLP2_9MICO|nr:FAD-dependent oxidoreductase [Microbacterium hominis]QKJ18995.1 FAD-dependent oxidoreductase [Microbacterium hominis]
MTSEFLIVGAGVGGLVLARRLALAGRTVTLLEAADRVGGQVAPLPIAGIELDAAAESFATRGQALADLLDELGLAADVVTPAPTPAWLHRADGTAVPLPATGVLGIPGDPLAADVVRAIGRPAAWRARLDAVLPAGVGQDAASLGALVRARMGRRVLEGLVAPVVRGVHSREPDAMPVEVASPQLRAQLAAHGSLAAAVRALRAAAPAGSQVAGLRGGMHRIPAALAADCRRLGVDLRVGTPAAELAPDGVSVPGTRLAGTVVRACGDPDGAGDAAPQGRTITLATLVVDASAALDAAPRGTGLLVAADAPDVRARALTHLTAKWSWVAEALPGHHVIRLSYDGDATDAGPADALIAQAAHDAGVLLGTPVRVAESAVRVWRRGARAAEGEMPAVGETAAGTGLAAVVAQAERVAADLLSSTADHRGDHDAEHESDRPAAAEQGGWNGDRAD